MLSFILPCPLSGGRKCKQKEKEDEQNNSGGENKRHCSDTREIGEEEEGNQNVCRINLSRHANKIFLILEKKPLNKLKRRIQIDKQSVNIEIG